MQESKWDAIDTRNGTITLRDKATQIVYLAVLPARTTQTSAAAMQGRIRISSADLGIAAGAMDHMLGYNNGGGIGTQSGGNATCVELLPLDVPCAGGNQLQMYLSQTGIEPADNFEIVAGIAYTCSDTENPGSDWYTALMGESCLPAQGAVAATGSSTTTASTSLGAVTVPSTFSRIIAGRCTQSEDGVTANAEAAVAWIDYTSTIGQFAYQEYPASTGVDACLAGTLVDGHIFGYGTRLPMYFNKGNNNQTVTGYGSIVTTISAANALGYGLWLRK